MGAARNPNHALPLQVAAASCYRRRGPSVEFLLVSTPTAETSGHFPKAILNCRCHTERPRNAAGVGKRPASAATSNLDIFAFTSTPKGVFFWKHAGSARIRDQSIPARSGSRKSIRQKAARNPNLVPAPSEARKILAKGREVKYARELQSRDRPRLGEDCHSSPGGRSH